MPQDSRRVIFFAKIERESQHLAVTQEKNGEYEVFIGEGILTSKEVTRQDVWEDGTYLLYTPLGNVYVPNPDDEGRFTHLTRGKLIWDLTKLNLDHYNFTLVNHMLVYEPKVSVT